MVRGVGVSIPAPGVEITLPEGTPWYGWAIVLMFATLAGLSPFVVQFWLKARRTERKVDTVQETVGSVHEQVANTHSTNLRVDIDGLQDSLKTVSEALIRMEAQGSVTATAVGFLTTDAQHTRRDLAEIRADNRANSEKMDKLREQFTDHLGKNN